MIMRLISLPLESQASSVVGVFVADSAEEEDDDDLYGIGRTVGSAVFNLLFGVGTCALAARVVQR